MSIKRPENVTLDCRHTTSSPTAISFLLNKSTGVGIQKWACASLSRRYKRIDTYKDIALQLLGVCYRTFMGISTVFSPSSARAFLRLKPDLGQMGFKYLFHKTVCYMSRKIRRRPSKFYQLGMLHLSWPEYKPVHTFFDRITENKPVGVMLNIHKPKFTEKR